MAFSDQQLKESVIAQYKETYPQFQDIKVTEIVRTTFGGDLAVVRAIENGIQTEGEICHIALDGRVTPFATTEELARYLRSHFTQRWYESLFSKSGISGIVTLVLLGTLCVLAFKHETANPQVLQILGGAFVAVVGFLFGTATNPK